jgi:hypothetical protein
MTLNEFLFYKYSTTTIIWSISNSISIPRGLKSFMLKNCKVDFLGNSEVAFFLYTLYRVSQKNPQNHWNNVLFKFECPSTKGRTIRYLRVILKKISCKGMLPKKKFLQAIGGWKQFVYRKIANPPPPPQIPWSVPTLKAKMRKMLTRVNILNIDLLRN